MLQVKRLECLRNEQILFSNLTFNVAPGTLLLISGTNGAGKSTLLKILAGLWHSFSGQVSWQEDLKTAAPPYLYIGHKLGLQPYLTPFENVQWLLHVQGVANCSALHIQTALEALGLTRVAKLPCEVLSKGQQQRVALARLWIAPSPCWILDEPFTALDEAGRKLLLNRFSAHVAQGGALIIASHQPIEVNQGTVREIALGNGE